MPPFGKCPLPNPPPRGREQVAADSSVAGRLKKKARNINGGNFSGSLYRKADEQTPQAFFRRPLNPLVVCVPQGTHAVGWGYRENGECVHTAHTLHTGYGLLAVINERNNMRITKHMSEWIKNRIINPFINTIFQNVKITYDWYITVCFYLFGLIFLIFDFCIFGK